MALAEETLVYIHRPRYLIILLPTEEARENANLLIRSTTFQFELLQHHGITIRRIGETGAQDVYCLKIALKSRSDRERVDITLRTVAQRRGFPDHMNEEQKNKGEDEKGKPTAREPDAVGHLVKRQALVMVKGP